MPIALPEGRPEEEEPVAYTPEGKPIYTEEERQRAIPGDKTAPPGEKKEAAEPKPEEKLDLEF